ncbi:MAG: hypothetical protein ACLTHC_07150 [Faecalibacterium sp.]
MGYHRDPGADELYEAEGIIAQSEANATRLFGTAHTYYSTEGSSQCIRAMLCLAMQGAPRTGKRPVLLAARNAHKALLYAAALLDFDIRWLWPAPEDTGALCSCPVTVQALSAALEELVRAGENTLRRLPDQPGLSGRDAGHRGPLCRLRCSRRAPAGG